MIERRIVQVQGIVQSVGFRPFVYALALRCDLKGRVFNNERGVLIELQGESDDIENFLQQLRSHPPPLAQIDRIEASDQPEALSYSDFQIVQTTIEGQRIVPMAADIATCDDCLGELFDPANRRYRYPFINCTNCGPRFTIIEDVPYDRANTTMREFAMCTECRAEYENPLDRRFHADRQELYPCAPASAARESWTC